ncbi:hypothetical protein AXF42_Ash007593 [Apostasia shenzhenica]|uniref:Uncharacterized protein n=1 Tax=Apostasia shenzhenica TaxID=1088818 RepID=A0A2I0A5X0_9ASPA|nr:hypothetical protein AXF42_Ash007593 [Apostasia shenzhenica]
MEVCSPRALKLKQELLLKAEELERLIAIYKLSVCSDGMTTASGGSELLERRGQFYDIYMQKREKKLREEWRAKGAEKEADLKEKMESLASISSLIGSKEKKPKLLKRENPQYKAESNVAISGRAHSTQIEARKHSSIRTSSYSTSSEATDSKPAIRPSSLAPQRKENAKPSTGFSSETINQERSFLRSRSSTEKMSSLRDIKAGRPQSLRRNSASLGEPKDFMPLSADKANFMRISKASEASISEEDQLEESMEAKGSRKLWLSEEPWYERSAQRAASDFDDAANLGSQTGRVRKKWGSVERPFQSPDSSNQPFMDVTKGIRRLLKFGKKSRDIETEYSKEDGYHASLHSFSRIGRS